MSEDKWINVDPRTKKLSLRFRVRGFSRQFYISTGLKDSKTNRDIVRVRKEVIERDIALGRFDSTLEAYNFGTCEKPVIHSVSLLILWTDYLNFQSQILEQSTLKSDYQTITNIVDNLPTQSLSDAAAIRDSLLNRYSYHTAHKSLAAFSRCCKWAINSCLIEFNPFEKIQLPKPKKRSNENAIQAYTIEQRDLIISAFESHSKFSHYTDLIKFLFWTGCRPGEAFALTWGDVSADCCRISIDKAYASRVRLIKGTKNNRRRIFPCGKASRLQSLLLKLQPSLDPSELIFKSKTGRRMDLKTLDVCWRGNEVGKYHYTGVVTELDQRGLLPYLKVYSTRHTFATWAIASGSSPEKVAYWIGDNVHTVLKYYCHPDVTKTECPDF